MEILRVKLNYSKIKQLIGNRKVVTKRPILQAINYTDNYLEYTDSYSLVRLYTKNKVTGLFNINDLLFNLEGIYPSTQSLLDRLRLNEVIKSIDLLMVGKEIHYVFNNRSDIIFSKKQVDLALATVGLDISNLYPRFLFANEFTTIYLKTETLEIFILGRRKLKNE